MNMYKYKYFLDLVDNKHIYDFVKRLNQEAVNGWRTVGIGVSRGGTVVDNEDENPRTGTMAFAILEKEVQEKSRPEPKPYSDSKPQEKKEEEEVNNTRITIARSRL